MTQSWKLTLPCTRAEAEALNDDVPELALLDPCPTLVTREPDEAQPEAWAVEAYFTGKPNKATIAAIHALIPSAAKAKPILERLPDEDWVTVSQQGIAPIHAGRFYVHTSTNRGAVPPGAKPFQIEASRAFGTGSHATTEACLHMLDHLAGQGRSFRHIADIGTGTGLLAFAAGHLWPRACLTASDIDPVSIDVVRDNAVANAVQVGRGRGQVAPCVASGTDHPVIRARAPYDLVIANILAGPLIELAPTFAEVTDDGGALILAGLLDHQREAVASAYRAVGYRLIRKSGTTWPCLLLIKRRTYAWKRPSRASGRTTQPPGDFGTW